MADDKKANDKANANAPKGQSKAEAAKEDIESIKGIAAIGYIGLLFLVPLLMHPKSEYCVYHANQGLLLLIVAVVGSTILGIIPVIGWALMPLWTLAMIILVIIGIVNAVNGRMKPLPVIGGYTILKPQV